MVKIILPLFLFCLQPLLAQLPPALFVKGKKGPSTPLRVDQVAVNVEVIGNVAETVMTLRFRNDTDRVLEGELVFPLGEGQTISRYALEIGDEMREGVIVEKQRARQIFEDTIRQEIDPGLVEWTKGQNFRTRIYPIPAKGFKKVSLGYQEILSNEEGGLRYRLPLSFKDKLSRLTFSIQAHGKVAPVVDGDSNLTLTREKKEDWRFSVAKKNYRADHPLSLIIPLKEEPSVAVEKKKEGKSYFYLVDHVTPPVGAKVAAPRLEQIWLIWDASGSGALRDHEKELALLEGILKKNPGVSVELSLLRHRLESAGQFDDPAKLVKFLRDLSYDGGTDPGQLDFSNATHDAIFLVSDGIGTLGTNSPTMGKVPVHVFHAAPTAEHDSLTFLARQSGGRYQNLVAQSVEEALDAICGTAFQLLSVAGGKEIHPSFATPVPSSGMSAIAGRFEGDAPFEVTLTYGWPGAFSMERKVMIDPKNHLTKSGLVPKLWAGQKLSELAGERDKNRGEIISLGKKFGLVTPFTSLLVLDRIEDYVEHRIAPPTAKLREQYRRILKDEEEVKEDPAEHLDELAEKWKAMEKWHQKKYDPIDVLLFFRLHNTMGATKKMIKVSSKRKELRKNIPGLQKLQLEVEGIQKDLAALGSLQKSLRRKAITNYAARYRKAFKSLAELSPLLSQEDVSNIITAGNRSGAAAVNRSSIDALLNRPDQAPNAPSPIVLYSMGGDPDEELPEAQITLAKWDPKTPYLAALKKAAKSKREAVYFEWKKKNLESSAFYLDVSDFLITQGQKDLALRILTNVAELDLENIPLMRILAHRLNQLGEHERAFAIFEEVHQLRRDEPQSKRDLALTLASLKKPQEAADLLWGIIKTPSDDRFEGVHLISLVELNSLVARYRLRTSSYDERLLGNLDSDARIILTWDSDNSDMDLWITDALGEKCSYSHNLTESGGRMSNDFTDGYGPEEFLIKRALHGKYKIEANYYGNRQQVLAGATTIQVEIFTNWGRKNQKSKKITLRLKDDKEVVFVGEVELR